jgi:hypothetical protein
MAEYSESWVEYGSDSWWMGGEGDGQGQPCVCQDFFTELYESVRRVMWGGEMKRDLVKIDFCG